MPTVGELTAVYTNFLIGPRAGPDVCPRCFNFTRGYEYCYACSQNEDRLAAVVPISYSVAHGQLHHALGVYKRLDGEVARRVRLELAAVLWRHLAGHERCLARAAGVDGFEIVTTVPSSDSVRDTRHPLRAIVAELVEPTRRRYERLLVRSELAVAPRTFASGKFAPSRSLSGQSVLLIDDTWTSGASAQSAGAALQAAGSGPVAALAIGRHVNPGWYDTDRRLRALEAPFNWDRCAWCDPAAPPRAAKG